MNKTVFLYSGEGTGSPESSFRLIQHSRRWSEIRSILDFKLDLNLEEIWQNEIGQHRCPYSPLLTVATQICLADIWSQWGYAPDVAVGHSIGELSAAYQAGFYSLEEVLLITFQLGQISAKLEGLMLHGELSDKQIDELTVNLSSLNFVSGNRKHVTLSGYPDEMSQFGKRYPDFVTMKLPHPWHHPDYQKFSDELAPVRSTKIRDYRFVSGVSAEFETQLSADHWKKWLISSVDFIGSMQAIKNKYSSERLEIIELGFHPVLDKCCDIFDDYTYVSSMFRGEDEIDWIMHQRKQLDQKPFLDKLTQTIEAFRPGLDFNASLAYQNFTSLTFAEFSVILQTYFPSLAPQDFYRYKTVNQLIRHFGLNKSSEQHLHIKSPKAGVVIAGMSCKFPSSIENLSQYWEMLLSREDQVRADSDRGGLEAGFMSAEITRFDHKYFNISEAEARAMDPQQILALELTELLWKDAGIDPGELDRKRIGVYIGVWNQEYKGEPESVYYPTGTNPSIIASRISYQYDLRGPSWVSNTACSSSLVAVHYACKDIEAGRIDYAIAGGVNMILGNDFTDRMMNAGFLSADGRCKTFDDSANGYVRSEGGGLVLLANKNLADNYYAEVLGSSINQNGARSAIISAPHPEAQEELIIDACHDAAIQPQDIAYLECHGTGTKIGDPIEISAIQRTIAKDRQQKCYFGSVKSNIGHLESAAGIAGLIKSVLILCHGLIPPNLHFNRPNQYIDFESFNLEVASTEIKIGNQEHIGISSFGFGGTNAHIIIKGVDGKVRKHVENIAIPFDRSRSSRLDDYYQLDNRDFDPNGYNPDSSSTSTALVENRDDEFLINNSRHNKPSRDDVVNLIQDLFFKVTNIESIDPDVELLEQGLDSMSLTEFISELQSSLDVEIDPDLIFEHPLPDQLIDEIHALI